MIARARRITFPVVIAVLVGWGVVFGGCASRLMLHPELARKYGSNLRFARTATFPETVEEVNANGQKLKGWLFRRTDGHGVVLVAGGNAMGIADTYLYGRYLLQSRFSVLFFSYQGFDDNGGTADLRSLVSDAETFYALAESLFPGHPIGYVGGSISAATGMCLGAKVKKLDALVLEGLADPKSIVWSKIFQAWFLFPLYPVLLPVGAAITASVPDDLDVKKCATEFAESAILFIHHPRDAVAPYKTTEKAFQIYKGEKELFVPSPGKPPEYHLNVVDDANAERKVVNFLGRSFARRHSGARFRIMVRRSKGL